VPRTSAISELGKSLRNLAASSPIPFADRWSGTGNGLYGSGVQDRQTQIQAMNGQSTLFAIVQLLSTGSQAYGGWRMYKTDRDGRVRYARTDKGSDQRIEVLRHQALKLWKRPNPFMTGEHFREIGWQHMELVGEWYWVINRGPSGRGVPLEIWPVSPARMEPVPDRKKFLAGWVYTGPSGEQIPLSTDEVIQIKYPNPGDMYRGLSAVQSLLADIDATKYSAQWSRNFFLNSAVPGGVVTFAKRLTDTEFNEFTARWREQHQGVARGHRVGVLEQGAVWTPNTYTVKDMQFYELRTLGRDIIREAYRVHQAMLGQSTDVNRANAETAEEVHIAWHEIPRLNRLRTIANEFYLPMFGNTTLEREMDYEDPRPSSANEVNDELTAKTQAVTLLVDAGYDPHDALEVVGLPGMRWNGPVMSGTADPGRVPQPAIEPGRNPTPSRKTAVPGATEQRASLPRLGHPEDRDEFDMERNLASWIQDACDYSKVKELV
jgi:HK97 family phage portal protein